MVSDFVQNSNLGIKVQFINVLTIFAQVCILITKSSPYCVRQIHLVCACFFWDFFACLVCSQTLHHLDNLKAAKFISVY